MDTKNEMAVAFVKAQKEMKGAKKDTVNPFFKSKYADLASVVDAIKELEIKVPIVVRLVILFIFGRAKPRAMPAFMADLTHGSQS